MKRLSINDLDVEVGNKIESIDGGCFIRASWGTRATRHDVDLANHNVFRLDAAGNVVWQVHRVELPQRASWEILHRMAKERDPGVAGFFDEFWDMHLDEHLAQDLEPRGIYRPGCKISLRTERVWFDLDVETGIAIAKGHEFK